QDRVLLGLPSLVGEFRDALAWAMRSMTDDETAAFVFASFRRRADDLEPVFYALAAALPHSGHRRAVLRRMALYLYDLPQHATAATELLTTAARPHEPFDSFGLDRDCLAAHAATVLARRNAFRAGDVTLPPSQPPRAPGLRHPFVEGGHVLAEVVKLSA